jgi:hypothetical protein
VENTLITKSNIDKDCHLILEAISRLKDGTWCLNDEDSDWANYLFPKVKEALSEHVEYESQCVLPLLSIEEAIEHSADHEKILGLLEGLERRLRSSDAGEFQGSLAILIETLENHHYRFNNAGISVAIKCKNNCAGDDIVQRSKIPSLGYK